MVIDFRLPIIAKRDVSFHPKKAVKTFPLIKKTLF